MHRLLKCAFVAIFAITAFVLAAPVRADRWILSSARSAGRNGALFVTDVRLLNTSPTDAATIRLVYYPAGGTAVTSSDVVVGARQQKGFDNVLESLFGFSANTFGPIRVVAPDSVEVSSRTYNVTDPCSGGTFGSGLPGVGTDSAVTSGVIAQVAGSADTLSGARTNLIAMNPSGTDARVTVALRAGNGTLLGCAGLPPLAPNGIFQSDVFALVDAGSITTNDAFVEFVSDVPVLVGATVLDNRTGDSSIFLAKAAPPPVATTRVKVGDTTSFTGPHGVSGTATIVSPTTIRVTGFNADGSAPGLDIRVGISTSPRAKFPVLRIIARQTYQNASFDLTLPAGINLDTFDTFTVWCYEFAIVIAEGKFKTP